MPGVEETRSAGFWRRAALVIVAVAVAFLPSLRGGFVLWDDDMNFVDNPSYRGLSPAHLRWMLTTFHGGQFQPLSWLSLGVDYTLWGMNPGGYHLTSLLIHAVNAVLVYVLVASLLREAGARDGRVSLAALVGALFWAIHPLRVESVAWATARRDVLSGLFYLLAVLAYLRAVGARRRAAPWSGWFAAALAAFTLSLLAKGWGVTLPLVLLVLDVYPLRRLDGWRSVPGLLAEKAAFGLIALADAAILARMLGQFTAARSLADHGVLARAAQAAYGLVFYVRKTVVPLGLSPLYQLEPHLDPWRPRYVACALAVAGVTAALVAGRRRRPWALAAWLTYVAAVLPVLGTFQIGPQIAADRYTYLASLPAAVLVAGAARRLPASVAGVASALVLATLGVLTVRQTRVWHDTRALWEHALQVDPNNDFAELNLGWESQSRNDLESAERHYTAALRINPQFTFAYNNRGNVRQARGDTDGALADFGGAIAANPAYASPYLNRGTLRLSLGDPKAALADFDRCVEIDPTDGRGYNNRALARRATGDITGAIADYQKALELFPPGTPGREMIENNLTDARAAFTP
jgi:tetratricopeptide (TPR) repeat protein